MLPQYPMLLTTKTLYSKQLKNNGLAPVASRWDLCLQFCINEALLSSVTHYLQCRGVGTGGLRVLSPPKNLA